LKNQLNFLGLGDVGNAIEPLPSGGDSAADCEVALHQFSSFFLVRPLMMRHSQQQKYRGTDTTLMSLPPKVSLRVKKALF